MNKKIRIKPYLHLLERKGMIELIKTMDEGIKIQAGDFFNGFLETLQNLSDEDEIILQLMNKFNFPRHAAEQMLKKFFEMGVLEYYHLAVPESINRYHRQLLLFDSMNPMQDFKDNIAKQELISSSHVMIIGIGGIGNFIGLSLVAAGIGKLTLVDFDVVEESNLNRQVLFSDNDLGKRKTERAAKRLSEINPSCKICTIEKQIQSLSDFESLIKTNDGVNYVVLSADKPVDLVLWASALCKSYRFRYIKCGYMAFQGLIGPLLGYNTKSYEELFQSWADEINSQSEPIKTFNEGHIAPSMAATNSILANIAALELIKDMTGMVSVLEERRLLFNLKTMEMVYG